MSLLPSNKTRSYFVHSLVGAYGLLKKIRIINPKPANKNDLTIFHSEDYIDFLLNAENQEFKEKLGKEKYEKKMNEYGLEDDCQIFKGIKKYCLLVAGSTLTAAHELISKTSDIVINWDGGRHHAMAQKASGFCYVNDIVLGMFKLSRHYKKIMYIDLDIHHCNGVEEAFYYTSKVLSLSIHRYDIGFFPGTGDIKSIGFGRGIYHTINIPLLPGLKKSTLMQIYERVILPAKERYNPQAVVIQCGGDGLIGDPLVHKNDFGNGWNLDLNSYWCCVNNILNWNIPTMILGGGGYSNTNVACLDAYITAKIINEELDSNIPEHHLFPYYKPDFTLYEYVGKMADKNIEEMVKENYKIPIENDSHTIENELEDNSNDNIKHYKRVTKSVPYLEHIIKEIEKNISKIEI
ncbi:Arginase/deacetylase [Piromyces finnis]|uniref:Histone deacetylase n=1 Tax=Piromyces finnis TaxID=1754191 RepID=A0A1Y1VF42_9FUNG|nr:Arginase/deacetylase [Piromyces finnis]|eukprot:ORX54678.1 Arginase/deacetylase [Piromyces finnis]